MMPCLLMGKAERGLAHGCASGGCVHTGTKITRLQGEAEQQLEPAEAGAGQEQIVLWNTEKSTPSSSPHTSWACIPEL